MTLTEECFRCQQHIHDGFVFTDEFDAFVCLKCFNLIMSGDEIDDEARVMRKDWELNDMELSVFDNPETY